MNPIKLKLGITSQSNLFIGGAAPKFEIGGIDLCTQMDTQGYPIIPASSFKGVLRKIVRDMVSEGNEAAEQVKVAYQKYIEKVEKSALEKLNKLDDPLQKELAEKRFVQLQEKVSAEYLFGVSGLNQAPKLFFNDFTLKTKDASKSYFSIDTKNSIEETDNGIVANPHIYKTVKPGVTFQGEILFYKMHALEPEVTVGFIKKFIETAIGQFNTQIYRLGNSKSRGYGLIRVEIVKGEMHNG
ncbi:MAG TPA: hypothetical protein H9667_05945 [Firmicutes bacterium]|nr:hypothetical protein [Bacillota bacterium]